jgi:acyl-coenzyme A thioesterase PaaI-like protein
VKAGEPGGLEVVQARERAAAALRRLGHAVVGHECEAELLEQIAVRADRIAAEVEQGTPRSRPVEQIKRRLWETPPPDGGRMSHFAECVVSGEANPMGIGMEVRREGDEAVAAVRLGAAFEGAPRRAHGGITAALFDDIMGYVLVLRRIPAFTGELTVRYLAPVPVGEVLDLRARLRRQEGRKLWMDAEMSHEGELIGKAEGLFIAIPPERLGIDPTQLPAVQA